MATTDRTLDRGGARSPLGALELIGFVLIVLVLTLAPGGVWAGLLGANLKTGMAIPWSIPAALALLWVAWRYAGGERPWPVSERRRAQRRANRLPAPILALALAANAAALISLAGFWIVMKELGAGGVNRVPDFSGYPPYVVVLVLGCAAVVGGAAEEVGLRGYLQQRFEGLAPWPVAVLLTALVAAPAHALTQGFVWPTLVFYLLADVTYGVTAYLTDSILPGAIAHVAGLFVFFAVIWPRDAARPQVTLAQADPAFWGQLALVGAFGALAVWALARLARTTASTRASGQALAAGRPA